ncbi:MAG: long-chain fatty acid--CoA ligase [Asgard group archaeon]|nr:long-chain fatty acid--CoA ligase [Asgard group archaeon]
MAEWTKLYHKNIPHTVDFDDKISLVDLFYNAVEKQGKKPFLLFQGKAKSYAETGKDVQKLANSMKKLGIKKGDRVAILMANSPQFIVSYLSTLYLGAIVTAISPLYSAKEIEFQLKDSGSKIIITMDIFLDRIRPIRANTDLKHVVVSSVADELSAIKGFLYKTIINRKSPKPDKSNELIYKDLIKNGEDIDSRAKISPKEDLACLQYTGGTTGTPKGAMLTHYNLVTQAVVLDYWMEYIGGQIPGIQSAHVAALPLSHIFGLTTSFFWPMYIGGVVSLIPDPRNLEAIMKDIEKNNIHFFMGVPTMYQKIAEHEKVSKYDWSSLRCCISGGSALHLSTMNNFEEKTGSLLVEGYGLSEASPVTHVNPIDRKLRRIGIGIPIPNTESKIIHTQTGKDIPLEFDEDGLTGEGELLVRGPQVMKGYWQRKEETDNVITKDGWLKTGDVVKIDKKGYHNIVDRLKDCIFTSGFQVWPLDVEKALQSHPDITLAAVIPFKDEQLNEVIKAVVVASEGAPRHDHKTLKAFCKKHLAPYKVPKVFEYREEIPLSPVGKVLRRPLREEMEQQLALKQKAKK